MPYWPRKSSKHSKAAAVTPDQNRINSALLRLPGELRNLIYSYTIYPRLDVVIISHETKSQHFGKTVLSLPLFRVSHQVRAEALSYLVANKGLKICGYDTAAAFFDCIGPALRNLKSLAIAQPFVWRQQIHLKLVDLCFYFLDQATELVYIRVEHGVVDYPPGWDSEEKNFDRDVKEKVDEFVKDKEQVELDYVTGSYNSKTPYYGRISRRTERLEDRPVEGSKVYPEYSVMYMC